jgi:hypothetical protein
VVIPLYFMIFREATDRETGIFQLKDVPASQELQLEVIAGEAICF